MDSHQPSKVSCRDMKETFDFLSVVLLAYSLVDWCLTALSAQTGYIVQFHTTGL